MSRFFLQQAHGVLLRAAVNAEHVAEFLLLPRSQRLLTTSAVTPLNRPTRPVQPIPPEASSTLVNSRSHITSPHQHHHRRRRRSHSNARSYSTSAPRTAVQLSFQPSFRLHSLANFDNFPLPMRSIAEGIRQASTNTDAPAVGSPRSSSPPTNSSSIKYTPIPSTSQAKTSSLSNGLSDTPIVLDEGQRQVDWAHSFHGLSTEPFDKEAAAILLAPISPDDVEVKPDGIVYLPEIKYRRILNQAFGPGGWGLAPRGETIVTPKAVTREYALVAHGRLVSVARGEQDYFSPEGISTATEGCKSNAMMRCCKDLGVASELWDPRYIRKFLAEHAKEVWAEHVVTKKKKKVWARKDDDVRYPYKESKAGYA